MTSNVNRAQSLLTNITDWLLRQPISPAHRNLFTVIVYYPRRWPRRNWYIELRFTDRDWRIAKVIHGSHDRNWYDVNDPAGWALLTYAAKRGDDFIDQILQTAADLASRYRWSIADLSLEGTE